MPQKIGLRTTELNDVELKLLGALCSGEKQKEFARQAGLTPRAVCFHAKQAMKKLGARTVYQAVATYARQTAGASTWAVSSGGELRETFEPSAAHA